MERLIAAGRIGDGAVAEATIATITDPIEVAQASEVMAILAAVLAARQRERAACRVCRWRLGRLFGHRHDLGERYRALGVDPHR